MGVTPSFPASPPPDGSNRPRQRGDKTAALSALRDMLEALNRSWDGGGLYPHLLPGTQVAVGSVLLPGLLLELQREPELAFLQDEPEFQALLKRYGGGTH